MCGWSGKRSLPHLGVLDLNTMQGQRVLTHERTSACTDKNAVVHVTDLAQQQIRTAVEAGQAASCRTGSI
jgi:hypothetical protein